MLKKFLVGMVVLCGSSVANAALLVNYTFNGTNGASSFTPVAGDYGTTGAQANFPQSFSEIVNAGAFVNQGVVGNGLNGSINNNRWRTATNIAVLPNPARSNQLTLAPIGAAFRDGVVSIDSMQFKVAKTSAGNGNVISVSVEYQASPTAAWVVLGSGSSTGGTALNPNTITFGTPIVMNKNSPTSSFRFIWSRTNIAAGSNSGQADLEDLSFFGSYTAPTFVPEPASLAVFGSLAAFGLLGRFRRK
jgi:hypothetical protein